MYPINTIAKSNNLFFISSYMVAEGLWYSLRIGSKGILCDLDKTSKNIEKTVNQNNTKKGSTTKYSIISN